MRPNVTSWMLAALLLLSACTMGGQDVAASDRGGGSSSEDVELPGAASAAENDESVAPDVTVENGVAPYGAASAADSIGLEVSMSALERRILDECVREEGFAIPEDPTAPWQRDEALWSFNATFPYIEGLARDGLRVEEPQATGPDGELPEGMEPAPPGYDDARQACFDELAGAGAVHPASQIFGDLRVAWEGVLEEIEATDEVGRLAGGFSDCLLAEGVPADATTDEFAFLFHVDGLKFDADEDAGRIAEISEQYGKLYVECGRELFEARERLRGGERRTAFLAEHREDIQELTSLLRSEGVV